MLPTLTYRPARPRPWARMPEFEHMFDEFFTPTQWWADWMPTSDLYETDNEFYLEMEVPGFVKDEIDVTVEEGMLLITGHHLAEEEEKEKTFHVKERTFRRFTRTFNTPISVNADAVNAELENGILFVRLPKLEEAKPKKIAVAVK